MVGVFVWFAFCVVCLLLKWKLTSIEFATLYFVFADRRATARTTTFVEPCSIQPKKKVLSPSDRRPPTVRDTIVVLAGGRHCCIGLGGVGFAPSNEDLAFRDGVCYLMNLFLRTMFKLRQGPVQFLGLFLATEH